MNGLATMAVTVIHGHKFSLSVLDIWRNGVRIPTNYVILTRKPIYTVMVTSETWIQFHYYFS